MDNVIVINRKRVFTHEELSRLLPVIYRLTDEAQAEVKKLTNFMDVHHEKKGRGLRELEARLNEIVTRWQIKIEKLGGEPKGLWLADFDSGDGYFCWKFPENEICFWHGYQDGFTGRIIIKEKSRPEHYENSNCSN